MRKKRKTPMIRKSERILAPSWRYVSFTSPDGERDRQFSLLCGNSADGQRLCLCPCSWVDTCGWSRSLLTQLLLSRPHLWQLLGCSSVKLLQFCGGQAVVFWWLKLLRLHFSDCGGLMASVQWWRPQKQWCFSGGDLVAKEFWMRFWEAVAAAGVAWVLITH